LKAGADIFRKFPTTLWPGAALKNERKKKVIYAVPPMRNQGGF